MGCVLDPEPTRLANALDVGVQALAWCKSIVTFMCHLGLGTLKKNFFSRIRATVESFLPEKKRREGWGERERLGFSLLARLSLAKWCQTWSTDIDPSPGHPSLTPTHPQFLLSLPLCKTEPPTPIETEPGWTSKRLLSSGTSNLKKFRENPLEGTAALPRKDHPRTDFFPHSISKEVLVNGAHV